MSGPQAGGAALGRRFALRPDRRGVLWDLLLYVPTVAALGTTALLLWYGGNQELAYLLSFLSSLFLIIGGNRVLKTRLLLLPSAPVAFTLLAGGQGVRVERRDGGCIDLVKRVRIFRDMAGKSCGLSGLEGSGAQRQFVVHRIQFADERDFTDLQSAIGQFAERK